MDRTAEPVVAASAELGEGPVWDADTGTLVWLDLLDRRLHRSSLSDGVTTTVALDRTVGAVALRPRGRLVAAVPEGFADLDDDGALTVIAPIDEPPGNRMNDGTCAPDGSFWAGTMAVDSRAGAGTLYRLATDHAVEVVLREVTVSNGLDWTADGETAYFTDTATQRVDRLTVRADGGIDRVPFVYIDPARGVPDGLTVDAEGNVWVALCFGGAVVGYSSSGAEIATVRVPAAVTTSVAFGGDDLDLLLVTTGRATRSPEELRAEPHAGSVFACRTGTTGRPPARYLG